MLLNCVEFRNYRRFANTKLDVGANIVAIIGPNEAGKTSILRALSRALENKPFEQSELHRGSAPVRVDEVIIELQYLVEADDRHALRDLSGAESLRWFNVRKRRDGVLRTSLQPTLTRDRGWRLTLRSALNRVSVGVALARLDSRPPSSELTSAIQELVTALRDMTYDNDETYSDETLDDAEEQFGRLINLLSDSDYRWPTVPATLFSIGALRTVFSAFRSREREEHPNVQARRKLMERVPRFVLFSDDERLLSSEYELSELLQPPTALQNLLTLARVSAAELHRLASDGDPAAIAGAVERANSHLEIAFQAWSQSRIAVRIDLDLIDGVGRLRILVRQGDGSYSMMDDRSDGLRAFVALVAITALQTKGARPILLIDEVETHLHYEAQADLLRVLHTQRNASQVIYTTHSAGALPDDLGTGIRVVSPQEDGTSIVHNSFWALGPGLSPLLTSMGLGASALAFTTTRRALIAEGASEFILLPSLFREALGRADIGFQIVPGLAEVSKRLLSELDLEGGRVAFLVDGDDSGSQLRSRLISAGYTTDQVAQLEDGFTIEDLLDPDVYVNAVNEELHRSNTPATLNVDDIPSSGRARWIEGVCDSRGQTPPNKAAVGRRVLEQRNDRPLLSAEGNRMLRDVYVLLAAALRLPA